MLRAGRPQVLTEDTAGETLPRGGAPAPVQTFVRQGDVVPVVLDEVRTRGADLIVMTADARSHLGRAASQSVAAELLRRGVGPLVLVPPSFKSSTVVAPFRRVVVGLDGSSVAEAVLEPASTLAAALQAELLLLHVTPLPELRAPLHQLQATALVRALARSAVRHYLEAMADRVRSASPGVATRVVEGTAATRISPLAVELGATLIALATHGRGGLRSVPFGRVASGTLQRASVPVLLLRPSFLAPDQSVAGDRP
jgi:nucleotide-binding universal stress UspA family protein